MNVKKWVSFWFFLTIVILFAIAGFNYLIDPFSVNNNQLLSLKKAVGDDRNKKVSYVKNLKNIDNLILGSSRSRRINPKDVNDFLDGYTFNFSVESARPEDYYGILLYLEKIGKVPKNIIIGFDFDILRKGSPHTQFISNNELNFTNATHTKSRLFFKYLNIDTFKFSIQTIYHNIFNTKENKKFDSNNGFLFWHQRDDLIKRGEYNHFQKIKIHSKRHFKIVYSNGEYGDFSGKRIGYLKAIKSFVKKYNIKLYTYLTPVHCYHLDKIKTHKPLNNTLVKFKALLATQFNYLDFMVHNKYNCDEENFYDAVHQSYYINKLIVNDLFSSILMYGKEQRF